MWNIELGRKLSGPEISHAEHLRTALFYRMSAFFEDHDLLLLPTSQVLPFDIGLEYPSEVDGAEMENYLTWMASCSSVSVTGLPACSVPGGFSEGLPIGVQFIGPPRSDFFLLQAAHAFEQLSIGSGNTPPAARARLGDSCASSPSASRRRQRSGEGRPSRPAPGTMRDFSR